jgi:uncharacterized membrane protein YgcG
MTLPKRTLALVLACALVLASGPWGCASQATQAASPPVTQPALAPQPAPETPEQLQQLVAPIALYPDALVAQILAAATYPEQVVEADRWLQQHTGLQGAQLAQGVDQQPWDPSVKALTQFPSVLANMDKNLSWTSALGDAYINQLQDVMQAIQVMRQRAQQAGNLQSTSQQQVTQQGQTIVIEPANPQVVYVPQYDPWVVYGAPVIAWPGWVWYPGLYVPGPGIVFGVGVGVGLFAGFGWGWHHWGADWHHHTVIFNHNTFISRSHTFINRNRFFGRGPGFDHGEALAHRDFEHDHGFARGFGEPHEHLGTHSGAFSGFDRGGDVRSFASRGTSSFRGDFHGRGGGFHGGGFHGGGGGSHGGGGGHR